MSFGKMVTFEFLGAFQPCLMGDFLCFSESVIADSLPAASLLRKIYF